MPKIIEISCDPKQIIHVFHSRRSRRPSIIVTVYLDSHLSGKWHFNGYGHHLCQQTAIEGDHKGGWIVVGEYKGHLLIE